MNQIDASTDLRHDVSERSLSAPLEAIETAYRRIENEAHRNCWIHVRSRDEAREECR